MGEQVMTQFQEPFNLEIRFLTSKSDHIGIYCSFAPSNNIKHHAIMNNM